MTQRTTCLFELMDLGAVVNLVGSLLFCLSLDLPYQAGPLVYGGPFHTVLAPDASWHSTWDEIRTLPGWWVPILLALVTSWIMSGFTFTGRRSLLEWSGLLSVVVVVGLMVGVCFAGLHLLGFGAAQFLGEGFWLSLAAMGFVAVGSMVTAVSASIASRSPWIGE